MNVSILGGAELRIVNSEGEEVFDEKLGGREMYEAVKAIAKELAERGHTVFHGGCGGVMRAAAEGAGDRSCAVVVLAKHRNVMDNIGSTCDATVFFEPVAHPSGFSTSHILYHPEVSLSPIDVGLALRRHILTRSMDAMIVAPGGTGTINEWPAVIGVNARKRGKKIPVLFLGNYWRPALDALSSIGVIPSSPDLNLHYQFVEIREGARRIVNGLLTMKVSCQ